MGVTVRSALDKSAPLTLASFALLFQAHSYASLSIWYVCKKGFFFSDYPNPLMFLNAF